MTWAVAARVAALVPAKNEAARVGATVAALKSVPEVSEIVVIDDGSEDSTEILARGAGARTIRLARSAGKGGALRRALSQTDAPILVLIDADLGATAEVARALLEPLLAGDADMTIARPPDGAPSGFGIVEGFARWGIRALSGRTMMRPLSGQRALRREIVDRFSFASGFGVEVGLTIDAVGAGYRVVEVPFAVEHARTGRDLAGFVHRGRQGWDIARALLIRAFRDRPRRAQRGTS